MEFSWFNSFVLNGDNNMQTTWKDLKEKAIELGILDTDIIFIRNKVEMESPLWSSKCY